MDGLADFLGDPKYASILKKAVEVEERDDKDQYRAGLGWEWHEVRAYPASLVKLVVHGMKVAHKSNRSTMYLLVRPPGVKKALR